MSNLKITIIIYDIIVTVIRILVNDSFRCMKYLTISSPRYGLSNIRSGDFSFFVRSSICDTKKSKKDFTSATSSLFSL